MFNPVLVSYIEIFKNKGTIPFNDYE